MHFVIDIRQALAPLPAEFSSNTPRQTIQRVAMPCQNIQHVKLAVISLKGTAHTTAGAIIG